MTRGFRAGTAAWLVALVACLVGAGLLVVLGDADALGDRRGLIAALIGAGLVIAVVGAAALSRPMATQLRRLADAATEARTKHGVRLVGDYGTGDLGRVARSFDAILSELDLDSRRRVEAEERLRHLSVHDSLTGLASRAHLIAELTARLGTDDATQANASILVIDIDDFSLVNDLWSYQVGDEVLVAAASRLRRIFGEDGLVARWGADEFAVLLPGVQPARLGELTAGVRAAFAEPLNTSVGPQSLATSVGVATGTPGVHGVGELIAMAETSLTGEQRSNQRVRSINPETARLVELALDENRLEVFYQPLVEMYSPTGTRIVGAEALVRLRADDGTLRVPADFLTEIMTSRYALDIDHRMASIVIAQLASWRSVGLVPPEFTVSLNVSPASLHDSELARVLRDLCSHHGVDPSGIVLELSEEAGELDQILAVELRQYGFRLSIDDLGLKRSNFDRLFNVGADYAKVHRRWLDDQVMLEALVQICQRKGLEVIAEGVETMEQLEMLYSLGVRLCQGYVISRPVSAASFRELLGSGRPAG